jgi:hypothetical protein
VQCILGATAFAIYNGLVREVCGIEGWHPADTLEYETRDLNLNTERESPSSSFDQPTMHLEWASRWNAR